MDIHLPYGSSRERLYGVCRMGSTIRPWDEGEVECEVWQFTLGESPENKKDLAVDILPVDNWGSLILAGRIDGKDIDPQLAKAMVSMIEEGLSQLLSSTESRFGKIPDITLFAKLGESTLGQAGKVQVNEEEAQDLLNIFGLLTNGIVGVMRSR